MTSGSQLPELQDATESGQAANNNSPPLTDNDNVSSICDVPALPGGESKVQILPDQSGDDSATEESNLVVPVVLYRRHPFSRESGIEGGDETCSDGQAPETSKMTSVKFQTAKDDPPHLSGRSRAILKEYFDEASPVSLPVGHTTVAFTEPHVYRLLRFLTDGTLGRSSSSIERMVINAVRGTPTVAPS